MKKSYVYNIFSVFFLVTIFFYNGCATSKNIYKKVTENTIDRFKNDKPLIKKKVLIGPILDHAGFGDERIKKLMDILTNSLEKEGYLIIKRGEFEKASYKRMRSLQYGIVIDQKLIKKADDMGMDSLLALVLNPIEVNSKRSGIWPFRSMKQELEISIAINGLDTINGTLFLASIETGKYNVVVDEQTIFIEDLFEYKEGKTQEEKEKEIIASQLDNKKFKEVINEILESLSDSFQEKINSLPWTGEILSLNGDSFTINGGKDVGMTQDMIFDVFDKGEAIRSKIGRDLYLIGSKIGEIRIIEIGESSSQVIPLNEAGFEPGQIIRLKNES